MGKKILLFALILLITDIIAANENYNINKWGISKNEALKYYCTSPEYKPVHFKQDKQYTNILMTRFHALNSSLIDKTIIIRSQKAPIRDLLFINNRLYSIKEPYKEINSLKFKQLYLKIKNIYGKPKVNKKRDVTTYSFKKNSTSVLLLVSINKKNYNLAIYFYNYNWTHALLLEDFI